MPKNVIYAQAGGVTSVINVSAYAVFQTIKKHPTIFGKTYAALNGILGVLEENLVEIDLIDKDELARLKHLPGAAFESCRFDLDSLENNPAQYQRVLTVFKTYDIGYFFYNGGNGSMLTAQKVADFCTEQGHKVICVGIAKTIDNDLAISHCSPGFGSAAKYIATSLALATVDIQSIHKTSAQFLVMETMGRDTGWLTLSGGLVKHYLPDAPLMILPAEIRFNQPEFIKRVRQLIAEKGYCVCVVSEGIKNHQDEYLAFKQIEKTPDKNYYQLGGAGNILAEIIHQQLNIKTHSITPDYLQRTATHLVSKTDWEIAYQAGEAAVIAAKNKQHGVLPIVKKLQDNPFKYKFETVDLAKVAERDKLVPNHFIDQNNFSITQSATDYLLPLIQGEKTIPFRKGIPDILPLKLCLIKQKSLAFKNY